MSPLKRTLARPDPNNLRAEDFPRIAAARHWIGSAGKVHASGLRAPRGTISGRPLHISHRASGRPQSQALSVSSEPASLHVWLQMLFALRRNTKAGYVCALL